MDSGIAGKQMNVHWRKQDRQMVTCVCERVPVVCVEM